jgi:hypothetical protein
VDLFLGIIHSFVSAPFAQELAKIYDSSAALASTIGPESLVIDVMVVSLSRPRMRMGRAPTVAAIL